MKKDDRLNITITETSQGADIDVNCNKCGEPISISNEYGMYCKNKCGMEKDKKAAEKLKKLFPFLKDMIP